LKKQEPQTLISDLGEVKLIERLTKDFSVKYQSTKLSIGDDSAVVDLKSGSTVISTDLLVDKIHFNLDYMPLMHLGYKAVVVNISDIYAMNAKPKYILVSIGVSNQFSVEHLEMLYQGIKLACKNYNIELIGGDTTANNRGLLISITAVGNAIDGKIVKRSGATIGDLLVVSGDLGAACLGLMVLERENQKVLKNPHYSPILEPYQYFIGRQLKPEAGKKIFEFLQKNQITPTSMIDLSDGLSTELSHLSRSSNVSFEVFEDKIPISAQLEKIAKKFNMNYLELVLNGGEDYELLMTIKQKDLPKIMVNPNLTVIGSVSKKTSKNQLIKSNGTRFEIVPKGWDGFDYLTKSHIQTHHNDKPSDKS